MDISETKTEESFPLCRIKIVDFNTSFHLDRNSSGGGIMN